jgi:hypothetical protein
MGVFGGVRRAKDEKARQHASEIIIPNTHFCDD